MMLERRKPGLLFWLAVIIAPFAAPTALASDDLDVTMRMVQDGEDLTGAVVREIRLPEPSRGVPSQEAAPRGQNERPSVDDRALERGREFGQSVSERAREARDQGSDRRPTDRPGVASPDRGRPDRLPDPGANSQGSSRP
ncbi:MAG: hypothetical protein VX939_02700 [Pseudomonadota bacterium]|nr:hypothetical protein [Pseudomonadota bacterium]